MKLEANLHTGVLPEKQKDKIDRVLDAVRHDRHCQFALGSQINHSVQETHEALVNHAGYSLYM